MNSLKKALRIVKTAFISFVFLFIVASCAEKAIKETQVKQEEIPLPEVKPVVETIYGYNADSVEIIQNTIKRNQNLADILSPYQVPYQKINEVAIVAKSVHDVRKLATDRKYEIICTKDSVRQAKCLVYHASPIDYVIYKFDDTVSVTKEQFVVTHVEKTSSGIITSSLYNSLIDNGDSPKLAIELSEIYAWQIDFFGIQKGDNYKIIYEELYVNDELIGVGDIKAAYFSHMDVPYYAFLYEQDSVAEYFDEEGNSLRKAFLKAPLSYRRISSKFSHNRLHPILKRRMAHLGIDYAAPKGTPVYSIGDGKVLKAKYEGAAGNYVKIKHNSVYTSGYLHLWKFEKGIRTGSQVKQGQLIGYVGSTGRSTGPHLDFRVWKNGHAVDPLKLEPPSVKPIDEVHRADYLLKMKSYKRELDKNVVVPI